MWNLIFKTEQQKGRTGPSWEWVSQDGSAKGEGAGVDRVEVLLCKHRTMKAAEIVFRRGGEGDMGSDRGGGFD
jgi:hypothetical protein